ncbi:30S ribosomal protein S20 [Mucispirillum schaedleri]|uniref:Small ribosomal subunit protein bS20 n=1 Tax=Mucispirillum schaedleri ASF457 TaxID=1379858 RepID=V2Q8D6_9BACT|nr:30S ribosomal protein S20 [Mucispirillum schaedleri]MCX4361581.1 30S ribosomal protein S20 [Mucispirillum schaedleri]USF24907.1 30S ribosomal protein S20 [Mucispirillum schaedleri ASF457]SIW07582.1 30S ribosomal protein S20 [Mucispirillum schaedleri ASF457]
MAHTLSALKRIRQSEKRRLINKSNKSAMKTYIKKYMKALETGADNTEALLKQAVSVIYKTARKGAIHKKQASRKVSRLTMKFNKAQTVNK